MKDAAKLPELPIYNGPFVRQPGMYDVHAACEECCVQEWAPSMTKQSDMEDADINNIVNRFIRTGELPTNIRTPSYADYEGITDYHTAMNVITEAQSNFNKLPPAIRARFDNDPGQFVEFVTDPKNLEEVRGMGLAPPAKAPEAPMAPAGATPTPSGGEPAPK